MESNSIIKKKQHTALIALSAIVVSQIVFIIALNFVLGKIFTDIAQSQKTLNSVKHMSTEVCIVLFMACNLVFVFRKIVSLNSLKKVVPISCTIEDFFLIGYADDGKRQYDPFPIVRSKKDNRLYLSFGKDYMSGFNATCQHAGNSLVDLVIFKGDKSPVKIGDTADMYLLRKLDIQVEINLDKSLIILNNKSYPFIHVNEHVSIEQFHNLIFYNGLVDIG